MADTIQSNLRLSKQLKDKLELMHLAAQYHIGQRISFNDFLLLLLSAAVQDVENECPGAFQTGKMDLSFMFGSDVDRGAGEK